MKQDYKEKITQEIINSLESGDIPWISPFEHQLLPTNYLTKRTYNGLNLLGLWLAVKKSGFTGNYWIGFRQANQLGGRVRKGERGTPITICCPSKVKDENDDETMTYYYKTDYVFNLYSQVEGIEFDTAPVTYRPIKELDNLIKCAGVAVRHEGERAYYSIDGDYINMPLKNKFKTQVAYYQTLAHELIHSTLKPDRCNRPLGTSEEQRALEELVADIGAAYLLAEFGIKANLQNTAAYVQSWIKALKNDTDFIFKASKLASDAVKFLTNAILTT